MIDETMKALPADASLEDRRKALKRRASEFHCGTSWGKKVWSRECRKHLEEHYGLPTLAGNPRSTQGRKMTEPDIIFPFRGENGVSER